MVNRTCNPHIVILETPEFSGDPILQLTTEETPRSRLISGRSTPDNSVYWVLTRGE